MQTTQELSTMAVNSSGSGGGVCRRLVRPFRANDPCASLPRALPSPTMVAALWAASRPLCDRLPSHRIGLKKNAIGLIKTAIGFRKVADQLITVEHAQLNYCGVGDSCLLHGRLHFPGGDLDLHRGRCRGACRSPPVDRTGSSEVA